MYTIERHKYGFRITFAGLLEADEMSLWLHETQEYLATQIGRFGVVIDARDLDPMSSEVCQLLQAGQREYRAKGMERSAVIVADVTVGLQMKLMARQNGIHASERYFDASRTADWESKARDWVVSGAEPEG